ncbi:hypothetical protein L195_g064108, partial [Trifolium pratense]
MPANSSIQQNPSPSIEIIGTSAERRVREGDTEDTNSSRQRRRVDDVDDLMNSTSGLHKLQPGKPAAHFVF